MRTPTPPPAPDPEDTAQAQTRSNISTAIADRTLNATDQYTPDGSLRYNVIGYDDVPDGFGGSTRVPRYSATQTMSDANQRIYDTGQETQQNIANIGRDQSARIGSLLGTPVNLSNEATESRLMDLGMRRLQPQFDRNQESIRTRLANSGIRQGSAAWDAEMSQMGQNENDAVNSLLLSGRGQAVQEALAERNAPINEITALMSGSQVSPPNFVNTPQGQVAGTNYAGMVQDNYQNQMGVYNQQMNSRNAMMGGLFGLAGAATRAIPWSDRRLKTDIREVGRLDNGLPVYSFRYKAGGPIQIGLMADDVRELHPDAVVPMPNGFDAVDYEKAVA